ncbi:hypothetical protein AKJ43_00735 [candidate division MSBL1 archaeon SCGC-AAA261D19]|uniref:Tungstate ABC transporter substrate-binding protein WtpA n=1 Tax=candidate division MSBL1 archaeon SCGC-AAA261D19 TaxID=1698273 RepID=A0A133V8F2_9EURY|nr:hypothetical protein AKJ43_00735 [candidate division MSBL1 archaeon SCGC-AAA261D19]
MIIIVGGGIFFYLGGSGATPVKIFHAGSLAKPLAELEILFENQNNVDVQREPAGSVATVRKVTQLGKTTDLVAVADYSLIPNMMMDEYACWYIQFARNEMVIAHTADSTYADEVDNNNWYEILARPGVRFGFSNPNNDPCGYRTMMVIQLAEMYYDNSKIFDDLIKANTNITTSKTDNKITIEVPSTEELNPNAGKVRIESKETDLIHLLEEGSIDYAFEYRSIAVQYDLDFIELPAEANLAYVEYENIYAQVELKLEDEEPITAKPIVYGVTIPTNARHEKEAIKFVELLITSDGQQIFEDLGQPPINPPVASSIDKLPENLQQLVKA